jgi:AraC family transcriptional regulator, regulatory protein of adaptative response / methylated-DNA-[protein]-cysteine methyltransferase
VQTKLINYYRIEKAIGYLTEHFREQPSLDEVARTVHMSPFHFQKLFVDWVGISPKNFIQYLTMDYLRARVKESKNMIDAADMVGLSSQSRVHDLFVKIEGVSPQQYKTAGKGLELYYGYHATPFGLCFIAVSEQGVCDLHFIDEEKTRNEYALFCEKWSFASIYHRPDFTQTFIQKIFSDEKTSNRQLQVLVQGTDFKIKVWEALVNIPFGEVRSYQQLAHQVGCPEAVRAVATAAGQNPISFLIPCHRVITQKGTVGAFHYGKVRKQAMIAWEIAQLTALENKHCSFTAQA